MFKVNNEDTDHQGDLKIKISHVKQHVKSTQVYDKNENSKK